MRRFVCALIRSAQTHASERANIKLSEMFEWTNSHKMMSKCCLGKSSIADIAGWMYSINDSLKVTVLY